VPVEVEKWMKANASAWELTKEFNLKPGTIENGAWGFMESMLSFDVDCVCDNTARRTAGFDQKVEKVAIYYLSSKPSNNSCSSS